MSVEAQLRAVFADVFGVEPDALRDADSPETIEGWDSVKHLGLVLAIEGEFAIQFEAEEIADLVSFGAIRERLRHLGSTDR